MPVPWRRLLRPITREVLVGSARDLTAPLPTGPPHPGLTTRVAVVEDLPRAAAALTPYRAQAWPTHHTTPLGDLFREAYAAGDRCFLGEVDGTIAYIGWTRFTDASLRGRGIRIPLRPGEAYGHSVFVLPQFRSRGVAGAVGIERFRWLQALGIRRVYGWMVASNTPILKVSARLGYRFVAQITQWTWRIRYRVPLVTTITFDPADPLAEWCGPGRLSLRRGITMFREGRIPQPSSHL